MRRKKGRERPCYRTGGRDTRRYGSSVPQNTMVVVWVGREDYDEVVKAYSRCDDGWGDEEGGPPRFSYGERSG